MDIFQDIFVVYIGLTLIATMVSVGACVVAGRSETRLAPHLNHAAQMPTQKNSRLGIPSKKRVLGIH